MQQNMRFVYHLCGAFHCTVGISLFDDTVIIQKPFTQRGAMAISIPMVPYASNKGIGEKNMAVNMRILCAGQRKLMRVRYVSPLLLSHVLMDGILTDGWSCCVCLVALFGCLLFFVWLCCALVGCVVVVVLFHGRIPFIVFFTQKM